jgi:hypothetical protein
MLVCHATYFLAAGPATPALNTLGSVSLPMLYNIEIAPAIRAVMTTPKLAKSTNGTETSFFSHAFPPHCTVFFDPSSLTRTTVEEHLHLKQLLCAL